MDRPFHSKRDVAEPPKGTYNRGHYEGKEDGFRSVCQPPAGKDEVV